MAAAATSAPISGATPILGATAVVARIETTRPRVVFDGPNRARLSKKVAPSSSGWLKRVPRIFFAAGGAVLAAASIASDCSIAQPSIPIHSQAVPAQTQRWHHLVCAGGTLPVTPP